MSQSDVARRIAAWPRTCAVAPHPDLRKRWSDELEQARKSANISPATIGLERKPRRLGFDDGVITPPEEFPVGTPIEAIRAAAAERAPLRGTVRVIVVLVDFSDKQMAATQNHFHDLFFSTGVLPHGSVREYYTEVTNGLVTLDGDVVGPYRMPNTLAWYANNNYGIGKGGGEFRSPQLAHDAVAAADPNINFAPYDNDGNGYVDAFIVVHAGPGAEVTGNAGDIWSHKSTLSAVYSTDGTKIYGYLTIPEDSRIGVCAHELGHLLFGFPDLYDTDYTSEGIGNWCLMSGGSWNGGGDQPAHPCAWCKADQGWATVTNVTVDGQIAIPQVETGHQIFRAWKDGTQNPEYFLLENRQRVGFDAALPGAGLLIWHIDEGQPGNTDETHYKVGLLQSDNHRDLELNHNRGDAGDPYPGSAGVTSATGTTSPSTKSYANQDTCVSITNISASAASMTAKIAVHCGKSIAKDTKDAKDVKEAVKEHKDTKDLKDHTKEQVKEHKEVKELHKETKELKEAAKDHKEIIKEVHKEVKEIQKEAKDLKDHIKEHERPPQRPGGGGDPFGAPASLESLEQRVAALEAIVGGGTEPFISTELRPTLLGSPQYARTRELSKRTAAGDAMAKRELDSPPR